MSHENPYTPPASHGMPPLPQDMMPILQGAQFPLRMSFKFLAIAPTITIYDATGRVLLFVRQQIFRIREQVEVFADTARTCKVGRHPALGLQSPSGEKNWPPAGINRVRT